MTRCSAGADGAAAVMTVPRPAGKGIGEVVAGRPCAGPARAVRVS